jgi:hypothetical protein
LTFLQCIKIGIPKCNTLHILNIKALIKDNFGKSKESKNLAAGPFVAMKGVNKIIKVWPQK